MLHFGDTGMRHRAPFWRLLVAFDIEGSARLVIGKAVAVRPWCRLGPLAMGRCSTCQPVSREQPASCRDRRSPPAKLEAAHASCLRVREADVDCKFKMGDRACNPGHPLLQEECRLGASRQASRVRSQSSTSASTHPTLQGPSCTRVGNWPAFSSRAMCCGEYRTSSLS